MYMERSSRKDSTSKQTPRPVNTREKHHKNYSKLKWFFKIGKKSSKSTASFETSETEKEVPNLDVLYPPLCKTNRSTSYIADVIDGGALEFYPMEKKGPVYIINNFRGNKSFPFRHGGCHDVGKLASTFEALGFDVCHENNLTAEEMVECCRDWATRNYNEASCIIVALLTHGKSRDQLQGIDGNYVDLEVLLSLFQTYNHTLVGKPKIFLIQACRGDAPNIGIFDLKAREPIAEVERGTYGSAHASTSLKDFTRLSMDSVENSGFLPQQADRLIAFSTSIGHPAHRNTDTGSWYIEELTNVLHAEYLAPRKKRKKHHQPKHFADVLTEVQGRVSNYIKEPLNVQMPEFKSNLRGPIYL